MQLKCNLNRHFTVALRLGSVSDARGVSSRWMLFYHLCGAAITIIMAASVLSLSLSFSLSLPSLLINHPANDDEKHKRERAKKKAKR
jgi:hypothetical protein